MKQQENFRRWAKDFTAHFGQDAPGLPCYCYVEQAQPDLDSGQKVRYGLVSMITDWGHDGDGKTYLKAIKTKWKQYHLYNSGGVINDDPDKDFEILLTNVKDIADFIAMFAGAILRFKLNGFIRKMGWCGRNNYQPLFAGNGARISDAVYNTEMEGPGNYQTHNPDGTAISGVIEDNQDISPWRAVP